MHADRFTTHPKPDGLLPDLEANETRRRVREATGIASRDPFCRTSLHSTTDGAWVHVVTYLTRDDEPDCFFATELVDQLRQQQEHELRAFFATQP